MLKTIKAFRKPGLAAVRCSAADALPVILVLLAGLFLRLWGLAARSLWFDEAYEYWSAVVPIGSIQKTVITSFQPPLYSILLHFWLVISDQAVWLRLLSVGLSMITLALVMALAWQSTCKRTALIVGILMALLPSEIRYAQEVSEYALMECMLACSLYFLFRTSRDPSRRNFLLWGLFSVLAIFSHYGTAIVVAATAAALFIENAWRRRWKDILNQAVVSFGGAACAIPLYVFFLSFQLQTQRHAAASNFTSFSQELINLVKSVGNTFIFPIGGWPYSHLPKSLGFVPVYLLLLIAGFVLLNKGNSDQKRILAWFWGSFGLYYLLIRFGLYSYGTTGFRYMMILVPLFVLVVASAPVTVCALLTEIRASRVFTWIAQGIPYVLIAVMAGTALYSLPNPTLSLLTRGHMAWPEIQNQGPVIQYWLEHHTGESPTYVYYGAVPAFRYYLRTGGYEANSPLPATWYTDCWQNRPVSYCRTGSVFYGEWFRDAQPDAKIVSIEKTLGSFPQSFWIIFSHTTSNEENTIMTSLSKRYTVVQSDQATGASIYFLIQNAK